MTTNKPRTMKKFLLLSRFAPTEQQTRLAKEQGIELIPGMNYDGFGDLLPPATIDIRGREIEVDGFVVFHSLLALRLLKYGKAVAIYENDPHDRGGQGRAPQAIKLHVFSMDTSDGCLNFYWNGAAVGSLQVS